MTQLYRHWDSEDNLLYVGISNCTAIRLSQHRWASEWYDSIVKITIERYETRRQALEAERIAIENEHPKFNIRKRSRTKSLTISKSRPHLKHLAEGEFEGPYGSENDIIDYFYLTKEMLEEAVSSGDLHIFTPLGMELKRFSVPQVANWLASSRPW